MLYTLAPKYLQKLTFSPDEASVLQALGEFKGKQALFKQQTPEILRCSSRSRSSSQESSEPTGITAPASVIEALVRDRPHRQPLRAGNRRLRMRSHDSQSAQHMELSTILSCAHTVCRYLPSEGGRWKRGDNEIIERNPDGSVRRVRFRPLSAAATPGAMQELVEGYRRAIAGAGVVSEPLIVIPAVVFDFLCIHPFPDGNGRTARLITLLLLYRSGYEVGRFISLERVFEESRQTYYESLEAASHGWHEGAHDVRPWLRYFWGVVLRAYREFEDRVGQITSGRGAKSAHVRRAVQRRTSPFAISDIEGDCPGVSRDLIRLVLRSMRDQGELTLEGRGRGARWRKP
jgi:Fic family protein